MLRVCHKLSFSHIAAACALGALPLTQSPAHAAQLTASWIGAASGQFGAASNWDIGRVPLNSAADSFIAYVAPGKSVLYGVAGAGRLDSLLLDAGSSISLSSPSLITRNSLMVLGQALFGGSVAADATAFTALGAGTDFIGNANAASAVNGAVVRIGATGFNASGVFNRTIASATGAGSVLELAGVQTINSGYADGYGRTNTISAAGGGVVDLSSVSRLIAPVSTNDVLAVSATTGGIIRLTSLQDIAGPTLDSGLTRISADGARIDLGPLQRVNRVQISLANGASMPVSGGGSVATNITNSTIGVSSGSTLNGGSLLGDFAATGMINTTLMSASGQGSLLDLSGLRLINSGYSDGYGRTNTVSASGGGVVNLSGVTRVIAPVSGNDALAFTATNGGSIRLTSLQDIAGATWDTGKTYFSADRASIEVGPVRRASRMFVSLANASTMRIGSYAGVAEISNSIFSVGSGSTLDGSGLVADYAAPAFINTTLMSASGTGSLLNLSGLQSLNSGYVDGYGRNNVVSAVDGGTVNLSGLRTIVTPASRNDALSFNAASGGSILLGALQAPVTLNRGQLNFNVATGGQISVGGFAADSGVHFNLVDAGSRITVNGDLALLAGSTLAAGKATEVRFTGDFSFAQTVASQVSSDLALFDFSGGGLQTLEVGGGLLATLTAGAAVTNNFAIGRLTVGTSGASTTVLALADAVNNGRRGATGHEVLYLNGVGGAGGVDGGDGLRILGGSTLVLDGVDLYTADSGAWLHVNTLFAPGVTRIAYDQGWIALTAADVPAVPEPQNWALLLSGLAALGWVARRRPARSARTF